MDLYHVLNRGVDKRAIVLRDADRLRFVHALYVMNDTSPAENTRRDSTSFTKSTEADTRERLVTVHAWCLMGNHYHLLLSDTIDGGISEFTRKLNIGYTSYFNLHYKRTGVLFQGKTKRILINREAHFKYILPYIHLNPLDFDQRSKLWRTQHLADPKHALNVLRKYRWSSYKNYCGESEFAPILAGSDFVIDAQSHTREIDRFLRAAFDSELTSLSLE